MRRRSRKCRLQIAQRRHSRAGRAAAVHGSVAVSIRDRSQSVRRRQAGAKGRSLSHFADQVAAALLCSGCSPYPRMMPRDAHSVEMNASCVDAIEPDRYGASHGQHATVRNTELSGLCEPLPKLPGDMIAMSDEHGHEASGRKPNRLINEQSPYLRQHAHNPVDWYAWGDEALARARAENKPILLSIGYSACHWCHVMERESFENEADRAVDERELRLDQSRSRGASRPRSDLHGRGSAPDRARRMAADRVPDARRRAVLRRHLLSARGSPGDARLSARADGDRRRVSNAARRYPSERRAARQGAFGTRASSTPTAAS